MAKRKVVKKKAPLSKIDRGSELQLKKAERRNQIFSTQMNIELCKYFKVKTVDLKKPENFGILLDMYRKTAAKLLNDKNKLKSQVAIHMHGFITRKTIQSLKDIIMDIVDNPKRAYVLRMAIFVANKLSLDKVNRETNKKLK